MDFIKLSEVEALDSVPENANALVEVDGAVKRVPGSGLGGSGGIPTAIIKSSNYDETASGISTAAGLAVTYSCTNMTYDDAVAILAAGEPLNALLLCVTEGTTIVPMSIMVGAGKIALLGSVLTKNEGETLVMCFGATWTADDITVEMT